MPLGGISFFWGSTFCRVYVPCIYSLNNSETARSQDSLSVRAPESWSKGWEFESRLEQRENCLPRCQLCVLILILCRSIPVLPEWHVKDPGHSAKSAGGRLHLNTHTPLTQWSRSGLTMPLSRHNVGPVRKRAYTQFVKEHSVTVVSARWAIVDW